MATGISDVAGVFALPPDPSLGFDTWAQMTGMHPGHPLVGGQAGSPGYGLGSRKVALAQQPATLAAASGAPTAAHWSQLFNLKGNPVGWALFAALAYYAFNFIHFHGGVNAAVRAGK